MTFQLSQPIEIQEQLEEAFSTINNKIDTYQTHGSGWTITKMLKLTLLTAEFDPISASSYIKTPKEVARKRAVLNIQNKHSHDCFFLSILAHIHPVDRIKHPYRESHYRPFMDELNIDGITTPMQIRQIPKFERQNRDISINVMYYDSEYKAILPLYCTKKRNVKYPINLFMIFEDEDGEMGNSHYTLIRSLSRLLYGFSKCKNKCHPCPYCLHRFARKDILDAHIDLCSTNPPCRIIMPSKKPKKTCKTTR